MAEPAQKRAKSEHVFLISPESVNEGHLAMATEAAQHGASTVVVLPDLPEASTEWHHFPKTDVDAGVPPIRLDGSKVLESGIPKFAVSKPSPTAPSDSLAPQSANHFPDSVERVVR
jgi:hypothetical protein